MMLTTTDDPREIERCYALGCSVYVTKPVEYEKFREAVQKLGLFLQFVELPAEDTTSRG
jgi:DNA-binding NarL/FixJ family response regulator